MTTGTAEAPDHLAAFDISLETAYKDASGAMYVVGIASDSTEDRVKERMSEEAIQSMAEQWTENEIDFLDHHEATYGIGKSHRGEVRYTEKDGKRIAQLVLTTKLDPRYPQAHDLFRDVQSGTCQKQLSVGVLISKRDPDAVMFEKSQAGHVVRVLRKVRLDHVASTRANRAAVPGTHFVEALTKAVSSAFPAPLVEGQVEVPMQIKTEMVETKKSVVPHKTYDVVEEAWDWSTSTSDAVLGDPADWGRYKAAHTHYDSAQGEVPTTKDAYKLPHHRLRDGSLVTVNRGVYAAMAALLGARGGVDIPDGDRKGVYDHLAAHYRDMKSDPPEFKTHTPEEFVAHHSSKGIEVADLVGDVAGGSPVADLLKNTPAVEGAPNANSEVPPVGTQVAPSVADGVASLLGVPPVAAPSPTSGLEALKAIGAMFAAPGEDEITSKVATAEKAVAQLDGVVLNDKSRSGVERIVTALQKVLGETAEVKTSGNNVESTFKATFDEFAQTLCSAMAEGMTGFGKGVKEMLKTHDAAMRETVATLDKRLVAVEKTAGVSQRIVDGQQASVDKTTQAQPPVKDNPFSGFFGPAARVLLQTPTRG
jgi:hypothetical protein